MSGPVRPELVELLLDLEPEGHKLPMDWYHVDGTMLTTDERDLIMSATWAELVAVEDLLALDVDLERGTR